MNLQAAPRLFFPGFEWEWHRLTLNFGFQQILPRRPNRISLNFSTAFGLAVSVSTVEMDTVDDGLILGDSVMTNKLHFNEIGPLIGEAWNAYDDFGGSLLTILEVSFDPVLLAERSK